jgi:hypothetical protein
VLCIGILCGFVSDVRARDRAERYANKRVKAIGAEINLTLDQMDSVRDVMVSSVRSMLKAAAGERSTAEQRGAILRGLAGLVDERYKGIREILTNEQWDSYRAARLERAAEIRTEILAAYLLLTESQIYEIYEVTIEADRRIDAKGPQAEEGTKLNQRRGERSVETLQLSRDEAYKGILTAGQWEEYSAVSDTLRAIKGAEAPE